MAKSVKKPAKKVSIKKTPRTRTSSVQGKPQTMDELLAQTGYQLRGLKRGNPVEGIITEKTKKAIYIDIGGKTEGMVIDREMKAAKDYIEGLKIGDKVTAIVTQLENEKGQTLLSLKRAAANAIWSELEEKLKAGETLKVRGVEVNRGGLIVDVKGAQGFIPASQFGSQLASEINQLINRQVEVKLIEVDREKNRIIFSEKEVSEAELLAAQEKALKKIKPNDVFEGKVVGVMPFGLFVKVATAKTPRKSRRDVGIRGKQKKAKGAEEISLEGLVHISEISWEKVEDPSKFYKEGDKIKVKVLAIDKKSGRLNLSIKQLQPDPWEKIEKKYPVEAKVKGEVTRLAPFGAFVQLEPGIEGLIHISKVPAGQSIKPGGKVDCYIESVDKEGRRLSLGLMLKEKPVGYK